MRPLYLYNENLDWLWSWTGSEVLYVLDDLEVVELALGEEWL